MHFFLTLVRLWTSSSLIGSWSLQCWWMTTGQQLHLVADLIRSNKPSQKHTTVQFHRGSKALTHTRRHAQRFPDQSLSVLSLSDLHPSTSPPSFDRRLLFCLPLDFSSQTQKQYLSSQDYSYVPAFLSKNTHSKSNPSPCITLLLFSL